MVHRQPPTPFQTDNYMAEVVVNGKIQPKRTKAMDMRFRCLKDREFQEQSEYIGDQENPIMQTIGKIIILKNTIGTLGSNFSRHTLY